MEKQNVEKNGYVKQWRWRGGCLATLVNWGSKKESKN